MSEKTETKKPIYDHSHKSAAVALKLDEDKIFLIIEDYYKMCDGLKPNMSKTIELVSQLDASEIEKLYILYTVASQEAEERLCLQAGRKAIFGIAVELIPPNMPSFGHSEDFKPPKFRKK